MIDKGQKERERDRHRRARNSQRGGEDQMDPTPKKFFMNELLTPLVCPFKKRNCHPFTLNF